MAENFTCVLCDGKFSDRTSLQEHFRSHGTKKKETIPNVVPKASTSEKIATFSAPSRCELCDAPCSSMNNYYQHYRLQHPNWRGIDCAHCGKHFLHTVDYDRHRTVHEGAPEDKIIACPSCESTFHNDAAMTAHKVMHEHVLNLQKKVKVKTTNKLERVPSVLKMKANFCKACGCQFVNSSALAQHLVTHSLFICLVCGNEMTDDFSFRNHQKVHLLKEAKSPTKKTNNTSGATAEKNSLKSRKRKK